MSRSITCHCGNRFEIPENLKEPRTNCPTCGSVFFVSSTGSEGDESGDAGYELSTSSDEIPVTISSSPRKLEGVSGTPEWLKRYREKRQAEKGPPDKSLTLIGRLGTDSSGMDSMGGLLYSAVTHSDAETSVSALVQVATSGHPVYAAVAQTCLEFVGPTEAAGGGPVLALLLEPHDASKDATLIRCLQNLGPGPTVPVRGLVDLLNSEYTELTLWAVRCLEQVGAPARSAVGSLLKLLRIENDELRLSIIDALGAIGRDPARVLPLLFQALHNKNPAYRRHAATALGKFGADAATAIAPLRSVLNDPDQSVKDAAALALGSIVDACGKRSTHAGGSAPGAIPKPIFVECQCGKKLKIKPELAGMKGKCPACGSMINIPVPIADTGASSKEKSCPACMATVAADDILCVHCGYDFRKQEQPAPIPAGA